MAKELNLHRAIKNNQLQPVINHLKKLANPLMLEQRDEDGLTPLQLAALRGMTELVLWLVAAGADINACLNHDEDSAIQLTAHIPACYLAQLECHLITAQVLLCLGAKPCEIIVKNKTLPPIHVHPLILKGLLIWVVTHQPVRAVTLLNVLDSHINHDNDYLSIDDYRSSPSPSILPSYQDANAADKKIDCAKLTTLLAGLSLLAQKNQCHDIFDFLMNMNRGNTLHLDANRILSIEQEQLYSQLQASRNHRTLLKKNPLDDCLAIVDYLLLQYDFYTLIPVVNALGIDTLITHAIKTDNQPLFATLMFSHDYFSQTLHTKIPHAIQASLPQLNIALTALGEKAFKAPLLYALMTNTLTEPARCIYEYLDNHSQLQFFKVSKASRQLHQLLDCWPNDLNHYRQEFQSLLKDLSYFKWRNRECQSNTAVCVLGLVAAVIFAIWLLLIIEKMKSVASDMHNTRYHANSITHCDDLLDGNMFTLHCNINATDSDNCTDLCGQITDLSGPVGPTLAYMVLSIIVSMYSFLNCLIFPSKRDFSTSLARFDHLSLYQLPIIHERAQALNVNMLKKYQLNFSYPDYYVSIGNHRTTTAQCGLNFFRREWKNSFFFKPPSSLSARQDTTIEVLDESDSEQADVATTPFRV